MAYRSQCGAAAVECHEPLLFSNPRQRHAGDPLGVAFGDEAGPADTVAVLETTAPAVAAWRDRRPRRANRPPVAVGSLPDRRLVPRGILPVDVSRAFVDPDGDALDYAVSSSATHVVTAGAAGARLTLTAVGAGAAEIRVTATDYEGLGATQPFTVTVSLSPPFTDDPIRPGVTPIKALHFTELRMRIDALRRQAGLERFPWTDPVLTGGVTPVRLVHLLELRTALAEAYAGGGPGGAPLDRRGGRGGDPHQGCTPDGTPRRGGGARVKVPVRFPGPPATGKRRGSPAMSACRWGSRVRRPQPGARQREPDRPGGAAARCARPHRGRQHARPLGESAALGRPGRRSTTPPAWVGHRHRLHLDAARAARKHGHQRRLHHTDTEVTDNALGLLDGRRLAEYDLRCPLPQAWSGGKSRDGRLVRAIVKRVARLTTPPPAQA